MIKRYSILLEKMNLLNGATRDYKEEWESDRFFVYGKMFAMLGKNKEGAEILTLRTTAERSEALRAMNSAIIPGYYMNKRLWISILLEKEKDTDFIATLFAEAYETIVGTLPKYKQEELKN
ncbi:MmcQ/YjbR family DNA-binding protein [Listeria fleischmannii]|uniref:MmcQ/YjbR family DNA-binding protein n=1 Tax=Listeria fleischmannii TaxID=1069827 RepID=UPI000254FA11|nr:MmcQ/YjbR family DNA-binding protein [Listeria fleischmannii]EIA21344.1 hypothetical protein KKC_01854 [Listeria fleischmannii subsp. coloradonensis]STY34314.1 Uncharacterized protein conserved in bacteria [Listeria fleischmannii subsp. coloradonensis]